MQILLLLMAVSAVLLVAYATYGRWLATAFQLNDARPTPAVECADGEDFVATEPHFLLGQHFSAIAAAGPIVGPILAGLAFGWLPAMLWIVVGCVFIGGVHDMGALVSSIRHRAQSVAEVVREHMSTRSYALFLAFIWLALVYIIVAFTDITAGAFVDSISLASLGVDQVVTGPGVATSSLLYLLLPVAMGLCLRGGMPLGWATVLFLPLVGLAIYLGQLPGWGLDMAAAWKSWNPQLSPEQATRLARQTWDVLLLGYCLLAGAMPVWLLLQPRGHLGGYFLYAALLAAGTGIVVGAIKQSPAITIRYPAFMGWHSPRQGPLFPMLFILIACGACSGFHALIASGTTSKQLRSEGDARMIGYGTMLLEGLVAVISLSCVMLLPVDSLLTKSDPNQIYALGLGTYLSVCHFPARFASAFALMAFTTFVYDTLDVCTRLGRYVVQELTGWRGAAGKWLGTAVTAGVPILFVLQPPLLKGGKAIPAWQLFWKLFGASNQLLAALTLVGITVWLWRTTRKTWVWPVVGLPAGLMFAMSTWALSLELVQKLTIDGVIRWGRLVPGSSVGFDLVALVAALLLVLAGLMLVEALLALGRRLPPKPSEPGVASPAPTQAALA